MYITPNSSIWLYMDMPFDEKYEQTILFDTIEEQNQYFSAPYRRLNNQSFQRIGKGMCRIQGNALDYVGVNYMMIENTRIIDGMPVNKKYYAFVNSVEYHNENCCDVTYTIDVLQTWMFDWTLTDCLIVRQHSESDEYKEHTIDEGFNVGDLLVYAEENIYKKDYCVITATKGLWTTGGGTWEKIATGAYTQTDFLYPYYPVDDPLITSKEVNKTPFPFYIFCVPLNGKAASSRIKDGVVYDPPILRRNYDDSELKVNSITARSILESYQYRGISDSIVKIQIAPQGLVPLINSLLDSSYTSNYSIDTEQETYTPFTDVDRFMNYFGLRNKKMACYPFRQFVVTAGQNNYTYKPELFRDNVRFKCWCVIAPTVEAGICPINYGEQDSLPSTYDDCRSEYTLINNDFQELPAVQDVFNAWNNRNSEKVALGFVSKAIDTIGGMATASVTGGTSALTGSFIGGETNLISSYVNYLGDVSYYSKLPNKMLGGLGNGNVTRQGVTDGEYTFNFRVYTPKKEYLRMYDDFFTRFGYTVGKVKTPNLKARPKFTYVQTNGCDIRGNIPTDDKKKINSIFDNGVTFWSDANSFGDFTVDNSPLEV